MYIISGRGRKSGVARATEATASLAPLLIIQLYVNSNCVLKPQCIYLLTINIKNIILTRHFDKMKSMCTAFFLDVQEELHVHAPHIYYLLYIVLFRQLILLKKACSLFQIHLLPVCQRFKGFSFHFKLRFEVGVRQIQLFFGWINF